MTGVPTASSEAALTRMKRQRQRDTKPEMAIRRELHQRGRRYRVHLAVFDKRRRHDIVFSSSRVVVDVRGCFWHGCPIHGTMPKEHSKWWRDKIEANQRRDLDTERRLADAGWKLVVVWEHDDPTSAADEIEVELESAFKGSP